MIVHEDGRVLGSVSGGCVEGAVVTEAQRAIETDEARVTNFGYSDDEAFAVGLSCGGTIRIFISPEVPSVLDALAAEVAAGRPSALATVIADDRLAQPEVVAPDGSVPFTPDVPDEMLEATGASRVGASLLVLGDGTTLGSLGQPALDIAVAEAALGLVDLGQSTVRSFGPRGERRAEQLEVFIQSFSQPPRMIILGAVDFTAALARQAKLLGFHVTVCDARPVFATRARFPMADEVVVDWPHRYLATHARELGPRDAVCVLTHDAKFDVPAIRVALETDVGYLGAMGSRRTNATRLDRLRAEGVTAVALERLMAPIGLDLGARSPEETAVAIVAEIIAHRAGGAGGPLRDSSGPIHRHLESSSPTR